MALLPVPQCKTYIDLNRAADKKYYNLERVRSYVEKNGTMGWGSKKKIAHELGLDPRIVAKALRTIQQQGC